MNYLDTAEPMRFSRQIDALQAWIQDLAAENAALRRRLHEMEPPSDSQRVEPCRSESRPSA